MAWQPSVSPEDARRVTCVGAGVIGGGWTALFLARGFYVTVYDPTDEAEANVRRLIGLAWESLSALGLADGAARDRLRFAPTLEEAVADTHFVQESAPERLDLKRRVLADLDRATPPGVVIASSTSGYGVSEMETEAKQTPERMIVGHPFNPPYLIPLVEIAGGTRTAPEPLAWAEAFYRRAGKFVLRLEREVPGFVGNRLQEALWREALHMLAAGEASVEEIDAAIREGPGLRWALMGPCLTFHLAGGAGGMAYMLDHFGPSLEAPWTRLAAPELTEALRAALVTGCEAEASGRTVDTLVGERDQGLVTILKARDRQ